MKSKISKIIKICVIALCVIAVIGISVGVINIKRNNVKQLNEIHTEAEENGYLKKHDVYSLNTNIAYIEGGFILKSVVLKNDNGMVEVKNLNKRCDYTSNPDRIIGEDFEIYLTQNEKQGIHTSNEYTKVVRGKNEFQVAVICEKESDAVAIADNIYLKDYDENIEIFDHKIAKEWSNNCVMSIDAIELKNGEDKIYIYPTDLEYAFYENDLLNTNAVIFRTDKTASNGYKVYLMNDQMKMFEVLAKDDSVLESAFAVEGE